MSLKKQLFWLLVWGMAFAYIEASVVVYLRKIYYPEGFAFPVVIAETHIAITELFRELMTLIIMWATVNLSYGKLQSKLAAFLVIFGIWDIFYYLFLKVLLDWPESLVTWDILFLIPSPWAGPVWAPVLVSLGIIYAGVAILMHNAEGRFFYFGKKFIVIELISALLIILSFLIPGYSVITQTVPTHFPWYLFCSGFIMGLVTLLYQLRTGKYDNTIEIP
ncbi:MAG: hypothetical protein U9Q62_01345 [Campylobacterota bacterium]|nr:hypothetical protein [Campylobacterota bacterium]